MPNVSFAGGTVKSYGIRRRIVNTSRLLHSSINSLDCVDCRIFEELAQMQEGMCTFCAAINVIIKMLKKLIEDAESYYKLDKRN